MATHHGKEGVVTIGGTTLGNATGFTVDTTHDVVEDTALGSSMKSFLVGRGTYTASIDMNFDETDSGQTTLVQGAELTFAFYQRAMLLEIENFLVLVLLQECQ